MGYCQKKGGDDLPNEFTAQPTKTARTLPPMIHSRELKPLTIRPPPCNRVKIPTTHFFA